jgi:hypothetical protein
MGDGWMCIILLGKGPVSPHLAPFNAPMRQTPRIRNTPDCRRDNCPAPGRGDFAITSIANPPCKLCICSSTDTDFHSLPVNLPSIAYLLLFYTFSVVLSVHAAFDMAPAWDIKEDFVDIEEFNGLMLADITLRVCFREQASEFLVQSIGRYRIKLITGPWQFCVLCTRIRLRSLVPWYYLEFLSYLS